MPSLYMPHRCVAAARTQVPLYAVVFGVVRLFITTLVQQKVVSKWYNVTLYSLEQSELTDTQIE